jgi:hypothetical protein
VWDRVPDLPTPVWGRDELDAGEMWNSNSKVSWLVVRGGLPIEATARLEAKGMPAIWLRNRPDASR